ncbi:50S ribosomal protein L11 methyltransferase [Litoribacter alkaliphilus]|uniref:50S ribosomal protein L11 methyltransferase n=1 Tax=Litoribacter ruber TaxID=702568 RepID=A0AAP2G490_9BACT|nr:50S ribosomal protein L11 methyltransferase [Litoribacter alkaliphilus]MBS9524255.1 50S ribosomal protein L11 methyltransferase [Litoribacter alkaliphilus]
MNQFFKTILRQLYQFWKKFKKESPLFQSLTYSLNNKSSFEKIDQHERMLADSTRMDIYFRAINKYVREGDIVVDLGTGTGILAFFASQCKAKKIYAIDHGNVINYAKKVAEANNLQNIEFIQQHSGHFLPPEKVDVILHEQIGDFLINEDMIRNLLDLKKRLLKPGGIMLPSMFEMYFEPITMVPARNTPFLWEHNFNGIDFSPTKALLNSEDSPLSKPEIYTYIQPGDAESFLAIPTPVAKFDIMQLEDDSFLKKLIFDQRIVKNGKLDGFALYFRIIFDEELLIDNSPFEKPTHWLPSIFRIEPIELKEGDILQVNLNIPTPTNEESWNFNFTRVRIEENSLLTEI